MKVLIKNVTGSVSNRWLLFELKRSGVNEGAIVDGVYDPKNESVNFTIGGNDCTVWIGETCEIIEPKNDN